MMLARTVAAFTLLISAATAATCQPIAPGGEPRTEIVNYVDGRPVQLRGAVGYQLMVELAPDEQVKNVALGDSDAWQVNVAKQGDRLFLKPIRSGELTNMTVVTSVRTYTFEMDALAVPTQDMPYRVAFRYEAPASPPDGAAYVDVAAATRRFIKYRMTGDRALRPDSVSDDGQHTYISWPASASIPAIYTVGSSGKEMLVNGMMRKDDVYVVDGVWPLLIFRVDRASARAERIFPPVRR